MFYLFDKLGERSKSKKEQRPLNEENAQDSLPTAKKEDGEDA